MERDTWAGRWKQLQGKAKETWGKLTDDDIKQIEGKRDILAGKLQEKYGYTKERANQEIDRWERENYREERAA